MTAEILTPQNLDDFFKLDSNLLDDLLALRQISFRLWPCQLLACPTNRKPLVVEQAPDLADDQYVLTLIIAAVSAPFDGFELWKLLLPVAQHMGLDSAQIAYLTDGEVSLARNWWLLVVIPRFQHMLPLGLLVFVPVGTLPRAEPL